MSFCSRFVLRCRMSVFYVALAGMLTAAAYSYRQLTDDNERRRVKWVAYGSMLSLTPQVVVSITELTGGAPAEWLVQFADAASAGIPIFVAYAVVKHRVFDIRVAIRRGLQYLLAKGALQALVAAPLAALTYTVVVNRHRTIAELVTESTAYLYWIAIAGLALRFRQPVRLWLDRRFLPGGVQTANGCCSVCSTIWARSIPCRTCPSW